MAAVERAVRRELNSWRDAGHWCAACSTPGVGPGQRWGFKEIRYHSPALVGFLRRLFPAAQFILLDRDPVELCVSDMLVSWSLDQLLADGVQHDSQAFERVVEDCLYAILAIRRNLESARALIAGRSIGLRYESLGIAPEPEMERVFGFLGLDVCAAVSGRLRLVSATVTGATDKAPARSGTERGLLTAPRIRETAARLHAGCRGANRPGRGGPASAAARAGGGQVFLSRW